LLRCRCNWIRAGEERTQWFAELSLERRAELAALELSTENGIDQAEHEDEQPPMELLDALRIEARLDLRKPVLRIEHRWRLRLADTDATPGGVVVIVTLHDAVHDCERAHATQRRELRHHAVDGR